MKYFPGFSTNKKIAYHLEEQFGKTNDKNLSINSQNFNGLAFP